MSGLDQPILLANSNYHVGQQMSVRVAEDEGYFQEEGFHNYRYESGGIIPGPLEPLGLARSINDRGIDIATAVNAEAVIQERSRGADLFIVGGWRFLPNSKLIGAKHLTGPADLRGAKIGVREPGGLIELYARKSLLKLGIDPDRECEWVFQSHFAYGNSTEMLQMLESGEIDAISAQPPSMGRLIDEGFPVLLDPFEERPDGWPAKVIVATGRVVEERREELRAFLRANTRAFWYMRDARNYGRMRDLEERLRSVSHNDDERVLRIVTSIEKVEGWAVPIHGGLVFDRVRSRDVLQAVIDGMRASGNLDSPLAADDVLREGPLIDAFDDLMGRPELADDWKRAQAVAARYGF